jgi:tryptophan-rich sensory protein
VRILVTAIAYLLSVVVVAALSFVIVLVLAGPHAGLLPSWLEPVILGLGWLAVFMLPVLVARRVWRHFGNAEPNQ